MVEFLYNWVGFHPPITNDDDDDDDADDDDDDDDDQLPCCTFPLDIFQKLATKFRTVFQGQVPILIL